MLPLSTRVTAARTRRANIYIYIYKGREGGRDLFTGGTGLHLTRNPELRISCRQCVHAMNSIARPTPLQPHHLAFPSIKLRQEEIWRWMVFIARASAGRDDDRRRWARDTNHKMKVTRDEIFSPIAIFQRRRYDIETKL